LGYSHRPPFKLRGGARPEKINLEWAQQHKQEIRMKEVLLVLTSMFLFVGAFAHADEATEQEVIKTLMDGNAYTKKNLKDEVDTVSKDGSLEFWSSGGFLQEVKPGSKPDEYESVNIDAKHIHVITLVPGKVAVAQYYSEGSMAPKVVPLRTDASNANVCQRRWQMESRMHWSPIASAREQTRPEN
jgi:hypothetical protein